MTSFPRKLTVSCGWTCLNRDYLEGCYNLNLLFEFKGKSCCVKEGTLGATLEMEPHFGHKD